MTDPKDLRDGTWRPIRARCLSDFRAVFTVDHIFKFGSIFAVTYPNPFFRMADASLQGAREISCVSVARAHTDSKSFPY